LRKGQTVFCISLLRTETAVAPLHLTMIEYFASSR
jgi:hypothetical protein